MKTLPMSPLDEWIGRKIGLPGKHRLNRLDLEQYQLRSLNPTLSRVRRRSSFYRQHFSDLPTGGLDCLAELVAFPFTIPEDIRRDPDALLCVSRDRIARVVTLETSGTTGGPKRLFFPTWIWN